MTHQLLALRDGVRGAPVGSRLALQHPDRVQTLIDGNAYDEGLLEFWDHNQEILERPNDRESRGHRFLVDPKSTRWQYGVIAECGSEVSSQSDCFFTIANRRVT